MQAPQPTRMQSFLGVAKSLIFRGLIIYAVSAFFRAPKPQTAQNSIQTGAAVQARNIFSDGTPLTLYVYLSESEILENFHHSNLFWIKENIIYGDWTGGPNKDGTFDVEKDVVITDNLKNNGSLFMHVYVTRLGNSPDPKAKNYNADQMSYNYKQLNR